MWMILASLAAVGALAALFGVQQIVARRRAARRPLPPLCATDDHVADPMPVQVFNRSSLVGPKRTLNVHAWDNTPDSGPAIDLDGVFAPDEDPRVIDRTFLTNCARPGTDPHD